jgi:hypothetical protein
MSVPSDPEGLPTAEPVNGSAWSPPAPPRGRQAVPTALAAGAAALFAAALGLPYGLLWATIAPKLPVVVVEGGKAAFGEAEPEQWVADEGWFVLLGLGFGVLAALLTWWLAGRWRGPTVLAALAVGAVGGGVLAWWIGHRIGLADYERTLAGAQPGERLLHPPALRIRELGWWARVVPKVQGVLLVEAFGAALTYTLLAGWSRFGSLRPQAQEQPDQAGAPAPTLAGPQEVSWRSSGPPDRSTAPAPPVPGEAVPPPD